MIPCLLFLLALGFLLTGLNPSFYVDDSPETITASTLLGIPHPPGYPLYTIFGHIYAMLPLAHLPFRVNLMSCSLAAAVCVCLYIFLRGWVRVSRPMASILSLLWITGVTTFPAALSAKTGIYHLTALFLVVILLTLGEGKFLFAFFLIGLSLAHHWMSIVVLSPGFILIILETKKEKIREWKMVFVFLALLVLGLSVNLYLPLRSHQGPLLNWGNPDSFQNFVSNFLRSQYLGAETSGGPSSWILQLWLCLKASFLEFSGLMLLAILGAWMAFKRRLPLARGMVLAWFSFFAVLSIYLNLPKERQYLIQSYVLSTHVFILIFSAWGLEILLSSKNPVRFRRGLQIFFIVTFSFLLLAQGIIRYNRLRQTDYSYTYDYVLNEWKSLPKNCLFYCRGDSVVFPSWYFQWVEGKRLDLSVVGVDGLPMEWVRRNLALNHPGLQVPFSKNPVGVEAISTMSQWMVEHNKELELYFSFNQPDEGLMPGTKLVPYGLVTKVFLKEQEPYLEDSRAEYIWGVLRFRHFQNSLFPYDSRTREQLVVNYGISRNSLGVYYEDLGDDAKEKLSLHPKMQDLLAIQGDYEKSSDQFAWAQNWDPTDSKYAYNLGNSLFHLGRLNDSMEWYRKATTLDPNYPEAYYNWAVAAMDTNDYQTAGKLFQKTLELNPGYAEAKRGLDFVNQNGRYQTGQ